MDEFKQILYWRPELHYNPIQGPPRLPEPLHVPEIPVISAPGKSRSIVDSSGSSDEEPEKESDGESDRETDGGSDGE